MTAAVEAILVCFCEEMPVGVDLHVEKRKRKILSGLQKAQRIAPTPTKDHSTGLTMVKHRVLSLTNDTATRRLIQTQYAGSI